MRRPKVSDFLKSPEPNPTPAESINFSWGSLLAVLGRMKNWVLKIGSQYSKMSHRNELTELGEKEG